MTEPLHTPSAVVVHQGQVPSHTPAFPVTLSAFDPSFYKIVHHKLRLLQETQEVRRLIYGPDADEWRPAHTPPDVRANHQTTDAIGLRHFIAIMTPPTPSTCSSTPPTLNASIDSSSSRASPTLSVAQFPPQPQYSLSKDERKGEEIGQEIGRGPVKCSQSNPTRALLRRPSDSLERGQPRHPNCHIRSLSPASWSNAEQMISTISKTPLPAKRKLRQTDEYGHIAVPRKRRQFPLTTSGSIHLQQSPHTLCEDSLANTVCKSPRIQRLKSTRSYAGATSLPRTSPEQELAQQAAVMTKAAHNINYGWKALVKIDCRGAREKGDI